MSSLSTKLALASCALVAQGAAAVAPEGDWTVDSSYLSYVEADDRVAVNKTLVDLSRTLDDGAVVVGVVHDTMSGASPTGAIVSDQPGVTYTGASGGQGFDADAGADGSLSPFEDTRVQLSVKREQELDRRLGIDYGTVVSIEDDYESFGGSLGLSRESSDALSTLSVGFGFTSDTIYRSDTGDTPEPLADVTESRVYGEASRYTYNTLVGLTRVVNRTTLAQVTAGLTLSEGYHSDPYKIISAADEVDRVVANFHESRPDSRLRSTLYGKLVHQLSDQGHSIQTSYRWYSDDWGIRSHTVDLRYRHALDRRHFLEPQLRFYRQSAADFYYRKLDIDPMANALVPEDGLASADYRLDESSSVTLGLKYGLTVRRNLDFRIRAAFVSKRFTETDFDTSDATVLQTSLRYRF